MQQKEFDFKGKKISYRTKGEGPCLLLLHGFGEDGTIWKRQYDIFPGHQLLIPDLPGTGESELIDDMSMEGMAEVIKELISLHSDGTPITLIGHSMGGYITLAFAEKYPEYLKAFGLFHSTAFADSEEKKAVRRKGIELIKRQGAYEFLEETTHKLYAPENDRKNLWVEEHLATVRNAIADTLVSYYEAMIQRPDRTAVLQNSKVPVLFVFGKHDTAVPLEDGLKLCHLPQLSYIHILQNSGHMGMVEEEMESNKILSQFITTIEK